MSQNDCLFATLLNRVHQRYRLWTSLSVTQRRLMALFVLCFQHQSSAVASAKAPSGRAEGWRGQSRLGLGCLALSSSRLLRRAVVQTESMMMVHAAFLEWNSAAKSIRAGELHRQRYDLPIWREIESLAEACFGARDSVVCKGRCSDSLDCVQRGARKGGLGEGGRWGCALGA